MSGTEESVDGEDFSASSEDWNPDGSEEDSEDEFEETVIVEKKNKSPGAKRKTVSSDHILMSGFTKVNKTESDDSDSNSSVDNYLVDPKEINFQSPFFKSENEEKLLTFEQIEQSILEDVNVKEDDDCKEDEEQRLNFKNIHDFAKNLECVKKSMQNYCHDNKSEENNLNIAELLAIGETSKSNKLSHIDTFSEDTEETNAKQKPASDIGKEGITITINLPNSKKSSTREDYRLKVCRRLNLIKKKNQVYIHKVHVLCWIAHGNYVNRILNYPKLLKSALALIPSNNCYPPKQTDLKYLEMILKWYIGKMKFTDHMKKKDKKISNIASIAKLNIKDHATLVQILDAQIKAANAFSKRTLVLIFIILLRALGLQCRLVLSFITLPLKPNPEDLYSLSKSSEDNKTSTKRKNSGGDNEKQKVNKSHQKKVLKKSGSFNKENIKNKKASHISEKKEKEHQDKSEFESHTKTNINSEHSEQNTKSSSRTSKTLNSQKSKITTTTKASDSQKSNSTSSSKRDISTFSPRVTRNKAKKKIKSIKSPSEIKISQLDGTDDRKSNKKLNIKKIKDLPNEKSCEKKLSKSEKQSDKRKISDESPQSSSSNTNTTPKHKSLRETDSDSDYFQPAKKANKNMVDYGTDDKTSNKKLNIKKIKELPIKKPSEKNSSKSENKCDKKKFSDESPQSSSSNTNTTPKRKSLKETDSDGEYFQPTKKTNKSIVKTKSLIVGQKDAQTKKKCDLWAEVYLEAEEKWICVDVASCKVFCMKEIYNNATHPVTYIVAWNNDLTLKDVTRRYVPKWNTITRKLRAEQEWWDATLKPWLGKRTVRDRQEDEELYRSQLEQPLPASIQEFKNHPLYALKRHLLKFEAIYPPDAPTLGFIRGEPVYARECVHNLHSRETWLKEAKVVRFGEKPYKIVKSRPKYDRLSGTRLPDVPLEIFGSWQIEDYDPPQAVNGIVPRNAYGNVDLFKPSMLPKGTVLLRLPGLIRIARKLQIDCAQAVVGFEIRKGFTIPTYDGFVVCKEFKDTLIAAWDQEEEEAAKKAADKVEKRVYGNWRKLIKALIIREQLKARYNFNNSPEDQHEFEKNEKSELKKIKKPRKKI